MGIIFKIKITLFLHLLIQENRTKLQFNLAKTLVENNYLPPSTLLPFLISASGYIPLPTVTQFFSPILITSFIIFLSKPAYMFFLFQLVYRKQKLASNQAT